MGDVYEEACFSQNNIYIWGKNVFASTSVSQIDSLWSETHELSGKENVLDEVVSKKKKKGHSESLTDERTQHLKKRQQ